MKKLLLAASVFFAGNAFPAILYGNLGPGESFGGGVTAECTDCSFSLGTVFTATGTGNLIQILVPVTNAIGTVTFELFSDSGGQPGTPLETWSNFTVPTDATSPSIVTIPSVANPLITAGNVYWFLAITPITTEIAWFTSPVLTSGGFWSGNGSAPWDEVQAAPTEAPQAIELDSAPEPATLALAGVSLLILAGLRRLGRIA